MRSDIPLHERDRRIAALRSAMQLNGLDALLVAGKGHAYTGRGYIRYLAEFHLWAHDSMILLPLEGDPVLTVTSNAVAQKIADRGWITDTRGDFCLVRGIIDAVREQGLQASRIGIAGTEWILPAGMMARLQAALPDATFTSADALFNAVRTIKSPLEIEQSRELWPVMQAAMDSFEQALKPGVTQLEAVAAAVGTATALGVRDVLAFVGEHPKKITIPEHVPLSCNDVVRVHLEICGKSGHWCERTMTYSYRDPTDLEQSLLDAEVKAFDIVREAAKPGVTLAQLSSTFEQTLTEQGWQVAGPSHHFDFHGQGLDANEHPWYSSLDQAGTYGQAMLQAGQIFSYHPRRPLKVDVGWLPDIHDNILIQNDGAVRLSGDWSFNWKRL